MKPSTAAGLILVVLLSKTVAVSLQRPEAYSIESHTGDVDSSNLVSGTLAHAAPLPVERAHHSAASLKSARDGDVRHCDCGCGGGGADGVHLGGKGCPCPACEGVRRHEIQPPDNAARAPDRRP
jgi:hypothetical protein